MPELPEVETIRKGLLRSIQGQVILDIWFSGKSALLDSKSQDLHSLQGQTIEKVLRKGKYLQFMTEEYSLLVHLGMSGVFQLEPFRGEFPVSHRHLRMHFANGTTLHYRDPRRFGYFELQKRHHTFERWQKLGPDAISKDFYAEYLLAVACKRQVSIKELLLNQAVVAGIGNIYASEILFASGVHPECRACAVHIQDCDRMVKNTKSILLQSIRSKGTTFADYRLTNGKGGAFQSFLKVFQKNGQPCEVCGSIIQKLVQNQRATFYCPKCQEFVK
jgi:formamidopyrimidine-DNA glycosylase